MKKTLKAFLLLTICLSLSFITTFAGVKPSDNAASISAFGLKSGVVRVKGNVPSKVDSIDDQYYLFEVNPSNDRLARKISSTAKSSSLVFDLKMADDPAYPILKYAFAVKTASGSGLSKYTRISPCTFVNKPQNAAKYKAAYKYPVNKKGTQGGDISLHDKLGSKNVYINLHVSSILNGDTAYNYNGKTYYFKNLNYVRKKASECNQKGYSMTVKLLLDRSAPDSLKAATGGDAIYYAFNVKDREARQTMDAMFSYLGTTFGKDDCYINNWILGNEVNSCSMYYYMGENVSESQFAKNYSASFRSLYNAIRSTRANSRVYMCFEHCWNIKNSYPIAFPGKSLLKKINKELKSMQSGIRWHLAYHAYPANLLDPAFWNDAVENNANSAIISPKNLDALTNYLKQEYGSDTRLLISEIGFDSSKGEDLQAAGLALAYYIAACNPAVDAFIFISYDEDPNNVAYGVHFGIQGKKAENVYKYMSTKNYMKYTDSILKKAVGSNWKSYVKGFKDSRIYTMYCK